MSDLIPVPLYAPRPRRDYYLRVPCGQVVTIEHYDAGAQLVRIDRFLRGGDYAITMAVNTVSLRVTQEADPGWTWA